MMRQDEALNILKTGANVFLTGEPGSGKTHTVNAYVSWLRERGIEPAITASTGIAATHIGGLTIHSWSGIGVREDLSRYDLDHIAQNERIVTRMRRVTTLIIDEISMLSADTLGMVDAVCRTVRNDAEHAFGGLQVVVVGDFFQLPPIVKSARLRTTHNMFDVPDNVRSPDVFAFTSASWTALNPIICYLSEQHRQEDDAFLSILSAIRNDAVSQKHREALMARRATAERSPASLPDTTHLYSHNADVDRINSAALEKIQGGSRIFAMTSRGPAALVETLKRGCLSPETLALKEGARVMFTKNDLGHAYVNGTTGVITGFAQESGNPIVKTKSGRTVLAEPVDWNIQDGGKILAKITQVPLRLAWAITVHKSQGMSLDAAHMDLSNAFEYGQGYVAISRVRTLAGLSLAGMNERALQVHPDVRMKDELFRHASAEAQAAFARMPHEEQAKLEENFIRASGGHAPAPRTETQAKAQSSTTKPSGYDKIREEHPNAYRPWTKADDEALKADFENDVDKKDLMKKFGRKAGAIHMRLVKLGLIQE